MRKTLLFWSLLLFLNPVFNLRSQDLVYDYLPAGVCYAGEKVKKIYIPPPEEFYRKAGSKEKAAITVFYSNFPDWAVKPFEFAVSILESILSADVKITVQADWTKISTAGVLANAGATGYAGGWAVDAFNPFAYYPVALAEKIYGEELNDETYPDIILTLNSSINWYTETDGNPLSTQYDLVTIVIHELIHGLGFFNSFNVGNASGYYGVGSLSVPLIFDTFVENLAGAKLTDTLAFANPSAGLMNELVSGKLFFNGPLVQKYTQGGKIQLYSPTPWSSGSSVSHLDEENTSDENGLMTPFIDKGEAIHDPGKLTISMLGDLGWINTRIIHDPPKDTEENLSQITLTAEIKSDTTYDHNKVGVVWSFDRFETSDTTYFSQTEPDNYSAAISIPHYGSELQYYLFAEDCFHRISRLPSFIDIYRFSVNIGADTVKPVLLHEPVSYYLESVDTFRFDAYASDNIGIDTVVVEYKINDGPSSYLGLKDKGDYYYSNTLIANTLTFEGKDSLRYRIIAFDKAALPNSAILPDTGYFSVKIEDIGPVIESYSTGFTDAADDFLTVGFEISKPSGFTNTGLHSLHPYESPETDGDSIVSFAMLRNPVIFNGNGMVISYKDLALVEPGEEGSLYGTQDFYDYVVLEGSKDFGKTWFSLAAGYDCRYSKSWETLYNSSIDGQNSTSIGNESLLMPHTLFPIPDSRISAGDTLMIRFRLFSDPYAYGWGWVIEDFHIGPLINSVEKTSDDQIVVYPNPGNGLLTIKGLVPENGTSVRYRILNSSGTYVLSGITEGGPDIRIDVSNQNSGIYFIQIYTSAGLKTYKYILIR